jgi:EAL domain-containing protein (putative c-di-GMP-specific phosphodiesterase class I)
VDSLYKRADDSLYISKIHGHDVLTVEGQTTTYDRDVDVNQLAYFAQPIEGVNAQGSVHWAAELLLRRYDSQSDQWRLPARFDIAVDKQIVLISQALTVLNVQRVNVNLTLAQFSDIETAKSLVSYMHSGRGPQQLTIEITDVPSVTVMRRVSALYREAGILIYIDDVGSDNSYELVQKLLPYVNGVKFAIQNLRRQESSARIHERIQFWLDIAQRQEISFILEGLEFPDEVIWAQHLGIQYFQGYYFGKPQLPLTA